MWTPGGARVPRPALFQAHTSHRSRATRELPESRGTSKCRPGVGPLMEPSDKGGGQGLGNCYSPVPKHLPVLKRASSCCERFGSHSAEELGNRAAGTAGPVTLSEATSFASRSALLCPRAVAVSPFLTSPAMRDRHCLRGPRSLWELKDLFSILYVSPP